MCQTAVMRTAAVRVVYFPLHSLVAVDSEGDSRADPHVQAEGHAPQQGEVAGALEAERAYWRIELRKQDEQHELLLKADSSGDQSKSDHLLKEGPYYVGVWNTPVFGRHDAAFKLRCELVTKPPPPCW